MAEESAVVEPEVLALVKAAVRQEMDLDFVKKVKVEHKGERTESRILALSAYRVYIVSNSKTAGKVESSFHILAIQTIESLKPLLLNITAADKSYNIKVSQPSDCTDVIAHIKAALKSSFPSGNPDRFRLSLGPAEEVEVRQERINNLVNTLRNTDADAEIGPCGGFSKVYACMCNFYGVQYLEEVAWDVDTIYLSHDTKEFNLQDFDHLDQKDLVPIISVLEFNSWFTKLICRSFKISSDVGEIILRVIRKSCVLEELVLDGISLGKEYFQKVSTALTSNPKSALHSFDFSNNAMEDRGLVHISGAFNKQQGIVSLSLPDNGVTVKSILSLSNALKTNKYVQSSLKRLNLSKNPLKAEGVTALSDFLAQPNALTHLDLSNTDCSLDLLFGALMRGCVQNLMHLNLAGNNLSTKKKEVTVPQSFQQFFSLAQDLKFVDLSNCKLPADAVRSLLTGFTENSVLKDVELDISKNELKSTGAKALAESLHKIHNIKSLNISDNGFEGDFVNVLEAFSKNKSIQELYIGQNFKSRSSNVAMEALVQLISEENSHIHSLSLADSKLKQDLIPLLDALGTNETLTKLDISGNHIGDEGARILGKALQLNSKLRTLALDKNNITHRGYNDLAAALNSNHTLYSIPSPLHDAAQCIKAHSTQCEVHLRKIETILLRNQSPHKIVAEQAYRLQQGLLIASTQQQAVDRLIVQLQDNVYALRNSSEENVKGAISVAKQYIQDADKLKQLLLKFHLCTDDSDIEAEFAELSNKFYQASQEKMKQNMDKILKCAKEVCPYITSKQDVESNLTTITSGSQRLSQTFVEEVILTQAAATILNRISENKLTVASIMADTIMDMVIRHMETSNVQLELLLKEHRQKQALAEYDDKGLDGTDDVLVVARKAKNRLSSALLVAGDSQEDVPKSHKRRPTVSRHKPKTSISEENLVVDIDISGDVKAEEVIKSKEEKKSPMVTKKAKAAPAVPKTADLDFSFVEKKESGLSHLAKDRPRPARGRRLPTRPSNRPQVTNGITNDKDEVKTENIDSFWAAPTENEPVKTHPKTTKESKFPKTPPRPAPKPAPKPKHVVKNTDGLDQTTPEKDEKESKKLGWIPKGVNIGLPGFFKKKRDRSGSGNDANNDADTSLKPSGSYSASSDKTSSPSKSKDSKKTPPPKPAPPRDRPTSVIPPRPAVKPRDRTATAPGPRPQVRERASSGVSSDGRPPAKDASKDENVPEKPAVRGPPKFGIGLGGMGGMAGGGLLAEMKLRQERTGSFGKVPPETVPKPPRRPSGESRYKSDSDLKLTKKPSSEDISPAPRPRVSTGESDSGKISEEGLVRPSSFKRPRVPSVTAPKPQIKPREKKEDKEQEENKKEEKKVEPSKEETAKRGSLKIAGDHVGESVDGGAAEPQHNDHKLTLKVKPDPDDSAELWVKRDMPSPKPSPKRSPKSPRASPKSPPLLDMESPSLKSDKNPPVSPLKSDKNPPISPLTRAATLPKPWSPAVPTSRSLPRKYSWEADRKVESEKEKEKEKEKEETKDEMKLERGNSIKEEKEEQIESIVDKKPDTEEMKQRSSSPFHLSPRKTPSNESKVEQSAEPSEPSEPSKPTEPRQNEPSEPRKNEPSESRQNDDQTEKEQTNEEQTETTAAKVAEEILSHPLDGKQPNPLEENSLLSTEHDDETKKRPLSTHSNNTVL